MADEPKVGVSAGEGAGDPGEKPDPAQPETPTGDMAGATEAETDAQRERDEYLANIAAQAAQRAVAEWARTHGSAAPSAPQAPPPTAGQGVVAELHREKAEIDAEAARLERAMQTDGVTAQHLLDHQRHVQREGRWLAKVNLEATRMSETERQVSSVGTEKEWREFVAQYPSGTDIALMRDAFERRQEKSKGSGEKPKPRPDLRRDPERPIVDVSGASEVSAGEKRARTMTRAQAEAHKNDLRESGDTDALIAFGKRIRSREVILKD